MKSRSLTSAVRVFLLLLLVSGAGALAQEQRLAVHYSGLINDYSPSTVKGGPWEMHGQWTLDVYRELGRESDAADFTVDMTMSGYGTTAGVIDATKGGQSAHTHHIKLTHAKVTWNMDGCPTLSPATTAGFQVNGTVSLLTSNGSIALFETTPPSSSLQVCVSGASEGQYSIPNSNVTLVFVGAATSHFGSQAIHGVVKEPTTGVIQEDRGFRQ
jgi:hypothetical protein